MQSLQKAWPTVAGKPKRNRKRQPALEKVTIQTSLSGRSAWAFEQIRRIKGVSPSALARSILDRWIDKSRDEIRQDYGLDLADYEAVVAQRAAEREGRGGLLTMPKADEGGG